ncbi:MAG: hypothetical protein KatS3mg033_2382 [Thermonema sp.]|jgi:hypothetical protein|uniref:DUF1987 domain-containing protein n=1 Tax=Thermonema TaxID=28194 RepID=UPI0005701E3E|nr:MULTISPECIES: DUF1987 domain-containing protein [Thermonema]GIV40582.1 MAG: hypothetical protein KatS3mg033_2382 [Thermonema sp.]
MENLEIEGVKSTYFTPHVKFDASTGKCLIEGESYLEDTWEFYRPILDWLKRYTEEKKGPIDFTFNLTYYNTSSSKCFLDIVRILKEYQDAGGEVKITWYYPEDDEDIREEAEDYENFLGIQINIIPVEE